MIFSFHNLPDYTVNSYGHTWHMKRDASFVAAKLALGYAAPIVVCVRFTDGKILKTTAH
jgi:hypothetical protein